MAIGSIALFRTALASLSIGPAFLVTILQLAAYTRKENQSDLLAKRVQLWHVCIYNIGTINAIGLVFALSGLYPQFWWQVFTQLFWMLIVEEVLFFMLATTLTLHYTAVNFAYGGFFVAVRRSVSHRDSGSTGRQGSKALLNQPSSATRM